MQLTEQIQKTMKPGCAQIRLTRTSYAHLLLQGIKFANINTPVMRFSKLLASVILFAGLTGAIITPPKSTASVTDNLDTKTRYYNNDGDGMRYITLKRKTRSTTYSKIFEYPLASNLELRYVEEGSDHSNANKSQAGPKGLSRSRPLADLEALELTKLFLQLSDAEAATGIAVNPNGADLGPLTGEFDVKTMGDADCKVKLYSQGIDVCGTLIGRLGIVNYTMLDTSRCDGWGRYCATRIFKFDFGFKSQQGRDSMQFYMLNPRVALDLNQRLSSWLGSAFSVIR